MAESPKPMILPEVFDVVENHASIVNTFGLFCRVGTYRHWEPSNTTALRDWSRVQALLVVVVIHLR